ncbi:hypothetical protein IWQ47_003921 [Aquimarina sp. EL_43]|uniref:hypothetical protein n=1 Tax=Aquimarina TaxID=290174 RepID=UPI000470EB57|nr:MULTISPECIES: hypothetical protein [Aquimarina]MBG6132697.1 hypothetical protein [Aquimarina sp. EL_35]MBG6152827.1 hypothetical protein [Aquimarina sp. EL_32]MBG6170834.1 hypothetical protein [Aquimarina sp. EL_43]
MNAKILKQNKFRIAICVTKNKKDKPIHTGYFLKIKDSNKVDVLLFISYFDSCEVFGDYNFVLKTGNF